MIIAAEAPDIAQESAVVNLLTDRATLAKYGEAGKEYARRYDWSTLFVGLHDVIGFEPSAEICPPLGNDWTSSLK